MGGGISNSQIVTKEGEYSLDAIQNNPDFDGSLRQGLNIALDQLSHILLPYGGIMSTDADFNDYVTTSWYMNNGTNKGQINAPYNPDNGILIVFSDVRTRVRHIWIGLYAMQFKTRTCIDGTWNEWKSFVLE